MYWKPDPDLYPPYLRSRIRKGKGVGTGVKYVSWIEVGEFPGWGTSFKVFGIRVRRRYHLHSEYEATHFFLRERNPSIVDIRENFPIFDMDRTVELCIQCGESHKYRGPYLEPFTIDFVITELINDKPEDYAESIKIPNDAANLGVLNRLQVERIWSCECRERHGRNLPWKLIDTSGYKDMLQPLLFMRAWFEHRYESNVEIEARFVEHFLATYSRNVPLATLIQSTAKVLRIAIPQAQDTFRYCAWADQIPVSLKHGLHLNTPLVLGKTGTHA